MHDIGFHRFFLKPHFFFWNNDVILYMLRMRTNRNCKVEKRVGFICSRNHTLANTGEHFESMGKIIIFSLDTCPYCKKVKELLQAKGAVFEEVSLTIKPEWRQFMFLLTNGKISLPLSLSLSLSLSPFLPLSPLLPSTRTSCPVGMCLASLTLAKFPFPIVFTSLYFPTYISSPGGLLEVPFDLDEDPPPLPEVAPADEGRVW